MIEEKLDLDTVIERAPTACMVMPSEDEIASEEMVYFCKKCSKIVENPKSLSSKNKLTYKCPECKEQSVCWGTKRSIFSHFRLNEKGESGGPKKRDKGNQVARLVEAKITSGVANSSKK